MRHAVSVLLATALLTGLGYGGSLILSADSPAPPPTTTTDSVRPVNAVLGNTSFRAVFGTAPSPRTPERLRLQTHLAYVEALLRHRPRPSLSKAQRARRTRLLDALHAYWTAGLFPRNTDVPGRSPVFIDDRGRLCAVGHLIAATAGRALAERIDDAYHLEAIRDVDLPAIDRWANRHGVTRRELAMIQPSYCGTITPGTCIPDDDPDASALEVTALSASVGASLLNGAFLERGTPSVVGGSVGLAGGATSLTIGLTDHARYPTASSLAGATSVVLGTWSLVAAIRSSEESTSSESAPRWSVAPTSVRTGPGTTRPGLRARLQF